MGPEDHNESLNIGRTLGSQWVPGNPNGTTLCPWYDNMSPGDNSMVPRDYYEPCGPQGGLITQFVHGEP